MTGRHVLLVEQLIYPRRRKFEPNMQLATMLVTEGDGCRVAASARDVTA